MLLLPSERAIFKQVSSKSKAGVEKLVLFLVISIPVTETREKADETAEIGETVKEFKTTEAVTTAEVVETAGTSKDSGESEGEYLNLAQVPCIWYPITFWRKSVPVLTLFNISSEVNAIYLISARELGLPMRLTDVGAKKIDGIMLETFRVIVTLFLLTDKVNWIRFIEETFLVANVSSEIVFGRPFLTIRGTDIDFLVWELQ